MYGSLGRVEGKKTKFFIDVKRPIRAGMQFGYKSELLNKFYE